MSYADEHRENNSSGDTAFYYVLFIDAVLFGLGHQDSTMSHMGPVASLPVGKMLSSSAGRVGGSLGRSLCHPSRFPLSVALPPCIIAVEGEMLPFKVEWPRCSGRSAASGISPA